MKYLRLDGICWEVIFRRSRVNPKTKKKEYPRKGKTFLIPVRKMPDCDCD